MLKIVPVVLGCESFSVNRDERGREQIREPLQVVPTVRVGELC